MSSFVLKKWIEPYVLLETLKKHYEMKDFTFDGWTKAAVKKDFFETLNKAGTLGLYMKNVNKFYMFSDIENFNAVEMFDLTETDFCLEEDSQKALSMVDIGKAEAAFISL